MTDKAMTAYDPLIDSLRAELDVVRKQRDEAFRHNKKLMYRITELERALEQAAQIAEQQELYDDTYINTRADMQQMWVKKQIAAKIRALAGKAEA